jgi:hypothetical protein
MTSATEVQELLNKYHSWLRDRSNLRTVNARWIEISTPFLDRHNDYIQIYAAQNGDGYELSDDGYTLSDLETSGCSLDTPKRKQMLQVTLNGFGVSNKNGILTVRARKDTFPQRKHALIQAILAVNDLFYLATAAVRSLFKEDVEAWLNHSEIRYLPNVQFIGQSGYPHSFDFAIPKSSKAPERLMKAIANPSKDAAQSLIFSWMDTKQVREQNSVAIAVLNNKDRDVAASVLDAFGNYSIDTVLWSERDQSTQYLVS